MSWQNYVDDVLIRDGGMSNAAIHGLDGSVWATSEGFELDKSEIDKLVCGCEDPDVARSNGVHLSGEKYVTIKADGGSLCAKNADTGVYAVKTNKAVIVGTFVKPTLPGEAESAMQSFADYLLKSGY